MEVFHQVSGFIDTEGHREKQRNTEKDCQCVFKLTKNTKDTKERRRGGFPAKTQGAREARWANAGRFAGETPADRSLPPIVFALGHSFNSLRHITKLRGRTHRTYRTTRTAAPPLDSQLPKAWRAKPAMPLQAPGPDVCLTHTHGPPSPPASCSLCTFVVLRVLCDSRAAFGLSKLPSLQTSKLFLHSGSPACGFPRKSQKRKGWAR